MYLVIYFGFLFSKTRNILRFNLLFGLICCLRLLKDINIVSGFLTSIHISGMNEQTTLFKTSETMYGEFVVEELG